MKADLQAVADGTMTMEQLITNRLLEAFEEEFGPELRREETRILYGTNAVKQPASKHAEPRRIKRRRKAR